MVKLTIDFIKKNLSPFVWLVGIISIYLIQFYAQNCFAKTNPPVWEGNKLGLEDKILSPWTAVTVQENIISCWGRDYTLDTSSLPKSIRSLDKELLSRPVELTVTSGGNSIPWNQALSSIKLSPNATRADLSGTWESTLPGQSAHINTKVSIEFDGMMLYEISVPDSEGKKIDNITIDIPLSNSIAVYRHRYGWGWKDISSSSGILPNTIGVIEKSQFRPYYWIGDDNRGLFWFSESDEMWPNGSESDAIQVIRTDKELLLRLVIKKTTQTLPSNWKLVFGLQATPVKPIPKNWRSTRLSPGRNANVNIIWPEPTTASMKYYGYPEAADANIFSKRVANLKAKGMEPAPYTCLTYLSTATPEWQQYMPQWMTSQFDTTSGDVKAFGASFARITPVGKGWSDFIVWKTKQFIDQFGITSLYHDNTQPYSDYSLLNGIGYIRNGIPQKAYPILGYRALSRRMYSVLKSYPGQTFTMAHMSSKLTIPILAYEDAYLDGEQFGGVVIDNYLDVLTLDAFRAEFVGKQWGLIPIFLPEFRQPYIDRVEPTRGLMALLMLHDVLIWPQWCNVSVVNEALAALDKFEYANADFIPYYAAKPGATTSIPNVYISAYSKNEGSSLLIIGNLGRDRKQGFVTLDSTIFKPDKHVLLSWPDNQKIESNGNSMNIDMDGLSYKMVAVRPLLKPPANLRLLAP